MYITDNADLPKPIIDGIKLSDIFDKIYKKLPGYILPYTTTTYGSFSLAPKQQKHFPPNESLIILYLNPSEKCLWKMNKQITTGASIFYDFEITIINVNSPNNYIHHINLSNLFSPKYDIPSELDWSNTDQFSYNGISLTNWRDTNLNWSDISASLISNVYINLPIIEKVVPHTLVSDKHGVIDDVISYKINSGKITYQIVMHVTGTIDSLIASSVVVNVADEISSHTEYSTFDQDGMVISGSISSYKVSLWDNLNTLLLIDMGNTTDTISIFNNGAAAITINTITSS